jgi:hypothetical protein
MLMKLFLCSGDFEKTLKLRRLIALALLGVGLIGFACYFLLVPGSSLTDHAQGFYLGAASGISAGAVILLCRTQYLLTHPAAQKKARIRETDERERTIVHSAFQMAGVITFFTAAGALFVVLPLSQEAFWALFSVIIFYSLVFTLTGGILEQKL